MAVITIPKPLRDKLGDEATEGFIEVIEKVDSDARKDLATKADILQVKTELEGELKLIKLMLGILIAGVISLIMKTFFI